MYRTASAFQVIVATSLVAALGLAAPHAMQGQSVMPGESNITEWVLPVGVQIVRPPTPGFSEADLTWLASSTADSLELASPLLNETAPADSLPGTQTAPQDATAAAPADGAKALLERGSVESLVRPRSGAGESPVEGM